MNNRMQLVSVLLVVGMFAAAGWLDEKAVIFPEVAALACGAWVMEKPPWHFTALKVWLSPTLAAFTGVAILRFFPPSPVLMICAAFLAVALQLRLMDSAVIPALSAAILPIITKVDSLLYPLSVCVLTGVIALVHILQVRLGKEAPPQRKVAGRRRNVVASDLKQWGKLSAALAVVAVAALRSEWLFMIAPPLIVTFVELTKPGGHLRQKVWQVMLILTLAAFAGVASLHFIHHVLHWPVWASAGITMGGVFLFYGIVQLPFPPAAAIALLPTIIPEHSLWAYPWHVLLGSATFVLLSVLWFSEETLQEVSLD